MKTNILKRLIPYLKLHKKSLVILTLAALVGNVLGLLGPYIIGRGINLIKFKMDTEDLKKLGILIAILLGIYLISALLNLLQNVTINRISQNIVYHMRKEGFEKVHRFSLKFIDRTSHGDMMSILINDVDNISNSLSQIGTQIVVSGLIIIIVLGIMTCISPLLTFIQLLLVVISGCVLRILVKKSREKMREQQSNLGKLSGYIEEMLLGQMEVKAFSYEEIGERKFKKLNQKYRESAVKAFFYGGFNYPTLNYIGNISYSVILILGAYLILQGKMTVGGISTFIIYSRMFNRPIANISDFYTIIQSVLVSAERYFALMDQPEERETGEKILDPEKILGDVQFENVNFAYNENEMVLKNLNFSVEHGKKIALVGPTGAGKTTVINLLMRFYEVSSGRIYLDGMNIQNYSRESYRKLFGMVLQDTWLFNGTILENIKYGNPEISQEKIVEVCKMLGAHEFIVHLKDGYLTVLDEENNDILSQGQKQLITIVRAVVGNPKILILDEATSGIDTRTEHKIQKAMDIISQKRTTFVIAHRLSTIKNSDLILVIKDGKIIEKGNHSELLKQEGFYRDLYTKQFEN